MKILAMSDTHYVPDNAWMRDLPVDVDVIIHSGDLMETGFEHEYEKRSLFLKKLGEIAPVIFVPGNHDTFFQSNIGFIKYDLSKSNIKVCCSLDDSFFMFKGMSFACMSGVENLPGWAFNKEPSEINDYFKYFSSCVKSLPTNNLDVLITHTPPFSILDGGYGSQSLLRCMDNLKKSSINIRNHIFGHAHSGVGAKELGGTNYFNVAISGPRNKQFVNKPIEIVI